MPIDCTYRLETLVRNVVRMSRQQLSAALAEHAAFDARCLGGDWEHIYHQYYTGLMKGLKNDPTLERLDQVQMMLVDCDLCLCQEAAETLVSARIWCRDIEPDQRSRQEQEDYQNMIDMIAEGHRNGVRDSLYSNLNDLVMN